MFELKDIIAGDYPNVVGWRLHNHKRKAKDIEKILYEDQTN